VRMVLEAGAADPKDDRAISRIAEQLGCGQESLRNWVKQTRIDAGDRPGTTTDERKRICELEKEVRELRRANEILRRASAYLAQAEAPCLVRPRGRPVLTLRPPSTTKPFVVPFQWTDALARCHLGVLGPDLGFHLGLHHLDHDDESAGRGEGQQAVLDCPGHFD
jgi:transposase